MNFPPHGFWIFGEAAGAADKNQDWPTQVVFLAGGALPNSKLGKTGETGQSVPGDPLGRNTLMHSLYRK